MARIDEKIENLKKLESIKLVPLFEMKYVMKQPDEGAPLLLKIIFSSHGFWLKIRPSLN